MVTADFLPLLARSPQLGRFFDDQQEQAEADVVVLTDATWRQHFDADPQVPGRSLRLNETPHTVLGVLRPGFEFNIDGQELGAFIPISHRDYGHSRDVRTLGAVGRLAAGVTVEQARQELQGIAARLASDFPATNAELGADLESLHQALTGSNRRPLLLLLGAGLLLLLIATTSVANLLVTRLVTRLRQVAVRFALGARPARVGRLFFLETAILSIAGAALGLLLAGAFLTLLPQVLPLLGGSGSVPGLDSLSPDLSTALFSLLLATAAALLFGGLLSWLARRSNLGQLLRESGWQGSLRGRLRSGLVVTQVVLSVLLLLGAGLLLRSFSNLLSSHPGFNSERIRHFGLGLPEQRYDSEEKILAFHQRLLEQLGELPAVEAVGAVVRLPLAGRGMRAGFFQVEPADSPIFSTAINVVSPGYFATLGTALVAGRDFAWADGLEATRVLLVNQAFRRTYFNDQPPRQVLGRRLALSWASPSHPQGSAWEIVGVVDDIRQRSLEQQAEPAVFLSLGQFAAEGCSYVLREVPNAPDLGLEVAATVAHIDNDLQRISLASLRQLVVGSLGDRRLGLWLTGGFAALALALTLIGIYGVLSFHVAQSAREMAIRISLGAAPAQIRGRVLRSSLGLTMLGCGLGIAAFWFLGRLLESQLYGVERHDPTTLVAVVGVLAAVAIAAALLPARRASRVAPMSVLREQ